MLFKVPENGETCGVCSSLDGYHQMRSYIKLGTEFANVNIFMGGPRHHIDSHESLLAFED